MEGKLEDGLKFEQGTTDLKGETHEIAQTVQVHQFKAPDPNSKRQAKRKVRNEIWAQLKAKKKEMKKVRLLSQHINTFLAKEKRTEANEAGKGDRSSKN